MAELHGTEMTGPGMTGEQIEELDRAWACAGLILRRCMAHGMPK